MSKFEDALISGVDEVLEEEIGGLAPSLFWGVLFLGTAAATYYRLDSKFSVYWAAGFGLGAAWFLVVKPLIHTLVGRARRKEERATRERDQLSRLAKRVRSGAPRPNYASDELWTRAQQMASEE